MKIRNPSPATAIDHDLAKDLAQRITVQHRQCWVNSLEAMAACKRKEVLYCEGWLMVRAYFPVEHGWLEYDGKVVDVSVLDLQAADYIAVFRYDFAQTVRLVCQRGGAPFYLRTRRRTEQMLQSFCQLPIDHERAMLTAHIGRAHTGISSVYIDR